MSKAYTLSLSPSQVFSSWVNQNRILVSTATTDTAMCSFRVSGFSCHHTVWMTFTPPPFHSPAHTHTHNTQHYDIDCRRVCPVSSHGQDLAIIRPRRDPYIKYMTQINHNLTPTCKFVPLPLTPLPKNSRQVHQTNAGKWLICKRIFRRKKIMSTEYHLTYYFGSQGKHWTASLAFRLKVKHTALIWHRAWAWGLCAKPKLKILSGLDEHYPNVSHFSETPTKQDKQQVLTRSKTNATRSAGCDKSSGLCIFAESPFVLRWWLHVSPEVCRVFVSSALLSRKGMRGKKTNGETIQSV